MSGAPDVVLALPGPTYWYRYDGDFTICGQPLAIAQEGGQGRGTGWSVWDGAVAAAKHLEQLALAGSLPAFDPPSILELGSGTGLAGLAAAVATGLPAVLTDLPEVLPALQRNAEANAQAAPNVTVAACDWTALAHPQPAPPYGLVLAADCVWVEELVAPFVRTLEALAGPTSQVLLAYQSRSSRVDSLLFSMLQRAFDLRPAERLPGEPDRGKIDLHWLRRKAGQ